MAPLACSGPEGFAAIGRNEGIALMNAAAVAAFLALSLTLFALGPRRWFAPGVLVALLVLHPISTIGARSGDCGYLMRDASWLFTIAGAAVLCWQVVQRMRGRGHPPSGGTPSSDPERGNEP